MANAAHTAAPAHTSTRVPRTGCWPASSAGTKIAELSQGDLLVTVSQVALPGPIDFEFSESTPEPVTDNVILLNYTYENTGDDSVWLTARSHQVDVFATDDTSVTKEDLSLGWFSLRYGSAPAYKAYVEQAGLNMYPLTEKGQQLVASVDDKRPLLELKPGESFGSAGMAIWNGEPSLLFQLNVSYPDQVADPVSLLPKDGKSDQ
ncbi:MAG: hypothetical protein ACTHZM_07030 [Canibacter sp.]